MLLLNKQLENGRWRVIVSYSGDNLYTVRQKLPPFPSFSAFYTSFPSSSFPGNNQQPPHTGYILKEEKVSSLLVE